MAAGDPRFRHPERFQLLKFREWIRRNKPAGWKGFTAEDLDLVIRVYGGDYGQDQSGCFALMELKYGRAGLGTSKRRLFGMIDALLRCADPEGHRYKGFFVVQYDDEDWDKANFTVNRRPLTREEFLEFLDLGTCGGLVIPGLWLKEEGQTSWSWVLDS